jgi:hypothetical protein
MIFLALAHHESHKGKPRFTHPKHVPIHSRRSTPIVPTTDVHIVLPLNTNACAVIQNHRKPRSVRTVLPAEYTLLAVEVCGTDNPKP